MIWCQGYSEPGAGSDLASLRTSAVLDGDEWVINGSKIWTSTAHMADWIFCLVRTEPEAPKHQGISFLLFRMDTPGIEIRPLMDMTMANNFNEVFFTDVRVPKDQIVGKRGEGWYVANAILGHERDSLGDPNAALMRLNRLIELMKTETVDGQRAIDNPTFRDRLMKMQGRVTAMAFQRHAHTERAPEQCRRRPRPRHHQAAGDGAPPRTRGARHRRHGRVRTHVRQESPSARTRAAGRLTTCTSSVSSSAAARRRYRRTSSANAASACPGNPRPWSGRRTEAMEFGLSQEQILLRDSVVRFLDDHSGLDRVRKYADDLDDRGDDLWAGLSELGVPALLVPEAHGGVGLSGLDAAVVAEALGGHVTPAPFLASGVLAVTAVRLAGDDAQQAEYLPRIADGSLRIGAALSELSGARADAGVHASDAGTLAGKALFVLDPDADAFLVADRGRRLHIVDRTADGVAIEFLSNVDRTQRIAELTLDNAAAETLSGSTDPDIGLQVIDTGRVMLAADTLGAAQEMLDQSVAYAKQREQFNRVIASFQAVKHMCAEMAAEIEPARALVWYAAHALGEAPEEARLTACHAKAHLAEVGTVRIQNRDDRARRHGIHRPARPALLVQAHRLQPTDPGRTRARPRGSGAGAGPGLGA